jgi:hypothetical protein
MRYSSGYNQWATRAEGRGTPLPSERERAGLIAAKIRDSHSGSRQDSNELARMESLRDGGGSSSSDNDYVPLTRQQLQQHLSHMNLREEYNRRWPPIAHQPVYADPGPDFLQRAARDGVCQARAMREEGYVPNMDREWRQCLEPESVCWSDGDCDLYREAYMAAFEGEWRTPTVAKPVRQARQRRIVF